jgi:hypothetical protein
MNPKVYIVRSFGPESGYLNLKAFYNYLSAANYASEIESQIPEGSEDEFVDIEEMDIV